MILVVRHHEQGSGRHTFGQGWSDRTIAETLTLAAITATQFSLQKVLTNSVTAQKELVLPVAIPYTVLKNTKNTPGLPSEARTALCLTDTENVQSFHMRQHDHVLYGHEVHSLPAWEVVVGDAKVEAWFQARAEALEPIGNGAEAILLQFERMADIIGKPLDTERYPRLAQYRQRMQIMARRKAFLVLADCIKHFTPEEMRVQENNVSHPPAPTQKPTFCAALVAAQDAGAEIADLVSLSQEFGMDIDPSKL